jgi:hypothetical protein
MLHFIASIFILFSSSCFSSTPFVLTQQVVDQIKLDLTEHLGLAPHYGVSCNAKLSPCPMGDMFGAVVRLVFHDAAGQAPGSNGCIDFVNTGSNRGLEDITSSLDQLFVQKNYLNVITKADLYVLAAVTVIEFASTVAVNNLTLDLPTVLHLPFRYGRPDQASCNDAGRLPSASFQWPDMQLLFGGRFNMTTREIVAIMGGHTLGRAESKNSGFDGGWVEFQSSFSNAYYATFFTLPWNSTSADSNVWEDLPNKATLRLTPDVELFFHSHGFGAPGFCSFFQGENDAETEMCPFQRGVWTIMQEYRNDIQTFYGAFTTAFVKLTETGHDGALQSVGLPINTSYPLFGASIGSLRPTNLPTNQPTVQPSLLPTIQPQLTLQPTILNSLRPTNLPTRQPSLLPTNQTITLTTNPPSNEQQTNVPTSMSPTNPPTMAQTKQPTNAPISVQPIQSTMMPSNQPTQVTFVRIKPTHSPKTQKTPPQKNKDN